MTQLYTLTIRKLKIVHAVDGSVIERFVEQVMTSMPMQFIQNWKRDFPAAFVSATPEVAGVERRGSRRFSREQVAQHARRQDHRGVSAGATPHTIPTGPADGYGLGDLINQELAK